MYIFVCIVVWQGAGMNPFQLNLNSVCRHKNSITNQVTDFFLGCGRKQRRKAMKKPKPSLDFLYIFFKESDVTYTPNIHTHMHIHVVQKNK